jgi:hypothetical protein
MTRVVIERLRILGLGGRAPTRTEVEAALRNALATVAPATARPTRSARVGGGQTLEQAAAAVVEGVTGRKADRR